MILDYNRKPDATVDEKVQSLMESTQLALNDIARAQGTADVAKEDAQTSIALSQTARQAANEASESAARAKEAADEAVEAVEEIEGDVSGLKTRVTQAEADIDAAESDISALGTRVGTAEGKITTIEGDVTSLEGSVTSLSGRVTQAESDIDSVEGDITTLQGDVSTAKGDITTLKSDVSTAKGDITTIQGDITNLSGRVSDAEDDIDAVEGDITSLQGRVSDAEDDVEDVMKGLALAEDVVGTLTWITAHSTVTTDTTPQQGTVYYIKHLDGTFEAVTDTTGKNPAQEGWYVLDEALQNYVLSHLSLQNDGLYVMKDGSHWKVKIGNDGVYILDPNNDPANQMTGSGNIIGYDDETHVEIDYHSMKLIDQNNYAYFYVSDLRSKHNEEDQFGEGIYYKVSDEMLVGSSGNRIWKTAHRIYNEKIIVIADGVETSDYSIGSDKSTITLDSPANTVFADYASDDLTFKVFTLGIRKSSAPTGFFSVAEGYEVSAEGNYSHAEGLLCQARNDSSHAEGAYTIAGFIAHSEGYSTVASGSYSHSEGYSTVASGTCSHSEGADTESSGDYSHAQNYRTITQRRSQTVLGEYNEADTQGGSTSARGKYVVIVGNGTSNNARSNALTIDWSGNVEASGDITDGSGNVLSDKADSNNVYTKLESDALLAAKADSSDLADYLPLVGGTLTGTLLGTRISVSGNLEGENALLQLDTTAQSGVDKEIYDALVNLGWDSDVIV